MLYTDTSSLGSRCGGRPSQYVFKVSLRAEDQKVGLNGGSQLSVGEVAQESGVHLPLSCTHRSRVESVTMGGVGAPGPDHSGMG